MRTVSCLIRSKAKPAIWAEFEVGLDDQDQKAWWLRRSSKVAFNQFPAKQGAWDYVTIHQISGDRDDTSHGIELEAPNGDGFTLSGVPKYFYKRLQCGQPLSGEGFRDLDGADIQYQMDLDCV
jgi:hypothetical protein